MHLPLITIPCFAALGAGGSTSYEALQRADAAWRNLRTRTVWGPRPTFVRETGQQLEVAPEYDVAVCGGTLGIFLACSLQLQGACSLAELPWQAPGCMECGISRGLPCCVFHEPLWCSSCSLDAGLWVVNVKKSLHYLPAAAVCSSWRAGGCCDPPSFTLVLLSAGLRVAVVERGPLAGRAQEWNVSLKELQELVGAFSSSFPVKLVGAVSTRFSRVATHSMDCTISDKERWSQCCCGVTRQPWF